MYQWSIKQEEEGKAAGSAIEAYDVTVAKARINHVISYQPELITGRSSK